MKDFFTADEFSILIRENHTTGADFAEYANAKHDEEMECLRKMIDQETFDMDKVFQENTRLREALAYYAATSSKPEVARNALDGK